MFRLTAIPTGHLVEFLPGPDEPPFLTFTCEQVQQTVYGLMATVTARVDEGHPRALPGGVVLMDRLNIASHRDRERMGRRMHEILGAPDGAARHDWTRYLEQAASAIKESEGAPVPLLDVVGPLPPPDGFLVVGLLARGDPNILYGAGGVGKSALCLRLAASVYTGSPFFGHDVMLTGRTLYLDWEDKHSTMIHRVDMVSRGMGYGDKRLPMILYKGLRGRGSYDRHHADIQTTIADNPDIALVVIDSTAMAMMGLAGDMAEQAIRFYSLVTQLPVTVLLLDHIASDDVKSGDGTAKPYGSVFKVNAARNMWEARNEEGLLLLQHRKHNTGPRMEDIRLRVSWTPGSVNYRAIAPYAPPPPPPPPSDDDGGWGPDD